MNEDRENHVIKINKNETTVKFTNANVCTFNLYYVLVIVLHHIKLQGFNCAYNIEQWVPDQDNSDLRKNLHDIYSL